MRRESATIYMTYIAIQTRVRIENAKSLEEGKNACRTSSEKRVTTVTKVMKMENPILSKNSRTFYLREKVPCQVQYRLKTAGNGISSCQQRWRFCVFLMNGVYVLLLYFLSLTISIDFIRAKKFQIKDYGTASIILLFNLLTKFSMTYHKFEPQINHQSGRFIDTT